MSVTLKENIQGALLPGSFFERPTTPGPPELERAARLLQFPPSYVIVGIYRLVTDKSLYARMGQV